LEFGTSHHPFFITGSMVEPKPSSLSDKLRHQNQTGADFMILSVKRFCPRSVRRARRSFQRREQLNEQNYKPDPATALGRPVDDFSRRILFLL
jgi:hypothetical protein